MINQFGHTVHKFNEANIYLHGIANQSRKPPVNDFIKDNIF